MSKEQIIAVIILLTLNGLGAYMMMRTNGTFKQFASAYMVVPTIILIVLAFFWSISTLMP